MPLFTLMGLLGALVALVSFTWQANAAYTTSNTRTLHNSPQRQLLRHCVGLLSVMSLNKECECQKYLQAFLKQHTTEVMLGILSIPHSTMQSGNSNLASWKRRTQFCTSMCDKMLGNVLLAKCQKWNLLQSDVQIEFSEEFLKKAGAAATKLFHKWFGFFELGRNATGFMSTFTCNGWPLLNCLMNVRSWWLRVSPMCFLVKLIICSLFPPVFTSFLWMI